jgi:hypothetical protein
MQLSASQIQLDNGPTRADRIIFEQVAGDALELFGYERENMPSSYASKVKKIYDNVWKRY